MAIAKNFRKHAEALLCQFELRFDPLQRVMQSLPRAEWWALLRAAQRGLLDSRKWLPRAPKRKPAAWPAATLPGEYWWTQRSLIAPGSQQ